MNKNQEKNFLEIVKKILSLMKKESFPIWQQNMERDLTHAFLFNHVYSVVKNGKNKKIPYKVVDLGALNDIGGYVTVENFIDTLTGEEEWNDDYGFKTYYIDLKEEWVNTALLKLHDDLIPYGLYDTLLDSLDDNNFKTIFIDMTEKFWKKWMKTNFKLMIDSHVNEIWEENKKINLEIETTVHEETQRFNEFQSVAIDYLNATNIEEVNMLQSKNKEILKKLQDWAKNKTYDELSLFDEFYPKSEKLEDFKWLDKEIYKEKIAEKQKTASAVSDFLAQQGVSVKKHITPLNIKQLYQLREDVFNIKGQKVVFIHNEVESYEFYFDEYNRVNGKGDGVDEFMILLESSLNEIGSLIVRQISDETYVPKGSRKKAEVPYINMYGAMLLRGYYKGLPSEEIHRIYEVNQETGEYFEVEEGTRFMDWNIGMWKEEW